MTSPFPFDKGVQLSSSFDGAFSPVFIPLFETTDVGPLVAKPATRVASAQCSCDNVRQGFANAHSPSLSSPDTAPQAAGLHWPAGAGQRELGGSSRMGRRLYRYQN